MKRLICIIFITMFSNAVFSADVVVCQSRGKGSSRPEAVKQALSDAVSQVKGVAVSSGDIGVALESSILGIDAEGPNRSISVDSIAVKGEGTSRKTESAGMIKSYEVISETVVDGIYDIKLKVYVYDYKSPVTGNREKLAVMPLRATADMFSFMGQKTAGSEILNLMARKLTSLITETNRFSVLDREYIEEFAYEQKILLSDAVSVKEKAKLAEMMGCDYMLVGTITQAEIKRWSQFSKVIGREISEYEANFKFEYQIVAAATSQILFSDETYLSLENMQVKKLVKKWRPGRLDLRRMRDNLLTMAAEDTVNNIIDKLFPVKIVKSAGNGKVIFNQGGKRFAKGQIYEIFTMGEFLTDPETGENLGTEEIRVGRVKVTQVRHKVTYAEVISGEASAVKRGMLCRLQTQKQ